MPLAEANVVFVVIGTMLVGVVGFVVMVFALLWSAFDALRRGLGFGSRARRVRRLERDEFAYVHVACGHADCRHVNPPGARFCARCGRALRRPDVDDYG